jgi:hypothetical protein
MRQTEIKNAPFTSAYVVQCMCPECPVQKSSKCTKEQLTNMGTTLCKDKTPLRREEIPALYCSTGTATCADINTRQACICDMCPVYASFKLENQTPGGFFCREGRSH